MKTPPDTAIASATTDPRNRHDGWSGTSRPPRRPPGTVPAQSDPERGPIGHPMLTPPAYGRDAGTLRSPTTGGAVFHVEQFPHPAPQLLPIPTGTARASASASAADASEQARVAGPTEPAEEAEQERGRAGVAFAAYPAVLERSDTGAPFAARQAGDVPGPPPHQALERSDAGAAFGPECTSHRTIARGAERPLSRAVSVATRVAGWPLLALLWTYRRVISPALPPACRYHPSCSEYAFRAIAVHGPARGFWLALRRLLRCHPWAPGGPDPVPVAPDRERGDR